MFMGIKDGICMEIKDIVSMGMKKYYVHGH